MKSFNQSITIKKNYPKNSHSSVINAVLFYLFLTTSVISQIQLNPNDNGNYALRLDGAGDYVQLGNPEIYRLNKFTLEAWIHVESFQHYAGIITLGDPNSERFSIHLGDDNSFNYMQDWGI